VPIGASLAQSFVRGSCEVRVNIRERIILFLGALFMGAPLALGAAGSLEFSLQKEGRQAPVVTFEEIAAL